MLDEKSTWGNDLELKHVTCEGKIFEYTCSSENLYPAVWILTSNTDCLYLVYSLNKYNSDDNQIRITGQHSDRRNKGSRRNNKGTHYLGANTKALTRGL